MKLIKKIVVLCVLLTHITKAQVSVYGKVDHLVPDGVDTLGNIVLTVSGSTAPYTYTWNPGAISTKDISNIHAGQYTLNVLSASSQTYTANYNLGYKVNWTNLDRCYFSNDSLQSTSGTPVYSRAVSKNTLTSNTDGWVEYVTDAVQSNKGIFGFTDSISPNLGTSADIDFGFYFYSGQFWYIENGVSGVLTASPKIGDVLRLERIGNTINYKINGINKRTQTITGLTSKIYKLKATLSYSVKLINLGCSFNQDGNVSFPNYVNTIPLIKHLTGTGTNDGSINLTPELSGTYNYTWQPSGANTNSITSQSIGAYKVSIEDSIHNISSKYYNIGYKVNWTNLDRCFFRNDTLKSTTGSSLFGRAVSKNTLMPNTDGWVEYILDAIQSNTGFFGFTDSISANLGLYSDIDFGFNLYSSQIYYIEYGYTAVLTASPKIGDVLRLERIGNTINYKINGVTIRTQTVTGLSSKTYKLKAALQYSLRLVNLGSSFNQDGNVSFPNYVEVNPLIKHSSGVGINDGSMSVTPKLSGLQSYSWQPTNQIVNPINSLFVGSNTVSVTDSIANQSSYTYNLGYKSTWTSVSNGFFRNDTLKATTTTNGYNYAFTKNTLSANTDGWFEYVIPQLTGYNNYIGFTDSTANSSTVFTDIQYGFYYLGSSKYIYAYESGTASLLGYVRIGDVLRIERIGNTINYKINGVTLRTVTNSATGAKIFKIKAKLGYQNYLTHVGISGPPCRLNINSGSNQTIICPSSSAVLSGTSTTSGITYSWSPGGTTPTSYSTTVSGIGTYTLKVTDASGCSSAATVAVISNTTVPPVDVKAYMTAATGSVTANGSLNLTVINGSAPYSYSWSDGSTNKDLLNKLPGVYSCTVTDCSGNQVKKDLIIGAENTSMTFTISPDALSGKDGQVQLQSNGSLANNNYPGNDQMKSGKDSLTAWVSTRSLFEFDLFGLPSNAVISSATLNLYGNGHNFTRANSSYLYLNTSAWDESSLTWNTQPAHIATNSLLLATTTTTNQNFAVNVTSQIQNWVQDPGSNFGWKLMLSDEATNNYAGLVFASSDHAFSGLRPNLIITINIPTSTETSRNWKLEETYDQNGAVISSTKVYIDDLGRSTQGLNRDASGNVFASQTIYDAYGRPAISSLPAYVGNTLAYQSNFMLNTSGLEYNYTNFDVTGKIATPDAIQTGTANTLGTYYSDANTIDAWQATATNPYSRTHYMADPYSGVKTTNGADNAFKAGSGREVRNYSMVCGDELKIILGAGNSYKVMVDTSDPLTSTASTLTSGSFIKASKSITTSPDNKEVVSYTIGDKVIATCMSGLASPDNCSMTSIKNYMDWYGTQSIDIHISDANKNSLSFPLPTYWPGGPLTHTVSNSDISYIITDINTETELQSTTDYSINTSTRALTFSTGYLTANTGNSLFLRIRVAYTSTIISTILADSALIPAGIVEYALDYGRWSVNYYDFAGNLRKTVSAKGINCSSPGTITMATTYDYNHLGQQVATKTPDEGLTEVAYNTNGQPRFTQNPEQKLNNRFSYVNYDLHGKSTENGEFSNLTGSGANGAYFQNYYNTYTAPYSGNIATSTIIDNADGLNDTYCNDVNYTNYEELSSGDDVPTAYTYSASYIGKYKNGQVSKTWNANTSTWYKYDIAGRLFATIKQVKDADYNTYGGSTANAQVKTYENAYDPYFGNVTNSYYQKNINTEYAEHQFTFDANKRLSTVNFVAGSGNAAVPVNSLSYDKLGRLKRQVIGPDLQGVDYVYTINGALKAINHPSLDYTKDRGQDLRNYSDVNAGVKQDLFGEIVEYFPNDYIRTGTSIETNTVGLYNGQIYGSRYKTRNDVNGTITGANYIDYLGASSATVISTTNYGQQELANRYTYDAFGQLATSTFGTYTNTTNSFTARTDYKEFGTTNGSIAYDANGNITSLKRNAYKVSGVDVLLDDLTYTITSGGNNHTKVADAASNSFSSAFNFKNPTGTAQSFTYNTNGQLTASPDESVTAISYYPNGQVKQITFANGNTTNHYYDDQGQKYKTKYVNGSSTKFTWFLFGAVYEYVSSGSFNLKELTIGGQGRAGVYKQDVTGIAIATGHAEYELTDHLGNVRVTFKKGTGTNLDVLSKTDYYAFGGQLPGRIWMQSGGDYRYGYQGQEKSQDDVNWDNFELRNFNHDLGRWSAPDPYGQFHSPYIAMANNPISKIDPNGGFVWQAPWQATFSSPRYYSEFMKSLMTYDGPVRGVSYDDIVWKSLTLDGPGGSSFGIYNSGGGVSMDSNPWESTFMERQENKANLWWDQQDDVTTKTYDKAGNLLTTEVKDGGFNPYSRKDQSSFTVNNPEKLFDAMKGMIKAKLDEVSSHDFTSNLFNGEKTEEEKNLITDNAIKQFFAIIVGESSNSHDEAQGIGEVLQRRMNLKGVEFTDNFAAKLGGKAQYNAIGEDTYNEVLNSSWEDLFSPSNKYSERIGGAIHSFISPQDNISKGAYYWNASNPKIGFNWNMYNAGTFNITTTLGQTTFFQYADPTKHWP